MKIRIEAPDGSSFELDEETSAIVFAGAKEKNVSPQQYLRDLINDEFNALMKVN